MEKTRLKLEGNGAFYMRVSGDRQEVKRQVAERIAFEKRHSVTFAERFLFEDEMPRDVSDKRPDWQRMMRSAETGQIQFIAVDQIDRFGFKDEWELAEMISRLRRMNCRLFDCSDEEWTAMGMLSYFKVGLAGHASHEEQVQKSHRTLGGMSVKAKEGQWLGGPPKLGLDIACFDKITNQEKWRVVFEGRDIVGQTRRKGKVRPKYHIRRLKVFPDGKTERMDGTVTYRTSDAEVIRLVPSNDQAKLAAVREVFRRYATEAVSFYDLAKMLKKLGVTNSYGNYYQSRDISMMLHDDVYIGIPTFNKHRQGRFHRQTAQGVVPVDASEKGRMCKVASEDVIRSTGYTFDPIVPVDLFNRVQRKLRDIPQAKRVPKNPNLYFAQLLHCAGCGKPMTARSEGFTYNCGSWSAFHVAHKSDESPCEKNSVRQCVIDEYLEKYLKEVGKRLELLTSAPSAGLTGHLEGQAESAWTDFATSFTTLLNYLAKNDPDQFQALVKDYMKEYPNDSGDQVERETGSSPFVEAVLGTYRATFDPSEVEAKIAKLEEEHDRLMQQWSDLPTPKAREKAKARFTELESQMEELKKQLTDVSEVVNTYYCQLKELQRTIAEVRDAMSNEHSASANRQKAAALRHLLVRIDCEFVTTGKIGIGMRKSRLVAIRFVPEIGDMKEYRIPQSTQSQRTYANL